MSRRKKLYENDTLLNQSINEAKTNESSHIRLSDELCSKNCQMLNQTSENHNSLNDQTNNDLNGTTNQVEEGINKDISIFTSNNFTTDKNQKRQDDQPLIQINPLNSLASLQERKKQMSSNDDEDIPKSLFEFSQNQKFKKPEINPILTFEKKPIFKFNSENIFNKTEGDAPKFVIKPFFTTSNPFKIPSSLTTSTNFAQSQVTFKFNMESQKLNNNNNEEQNVDEDEKEEESLPLDEKEKIQSNSQFEKMFQRQIHKLKTLKGISTNNQPSKKDNGYLSIEKLTGSQNIYYLVFRSFLGATQFTGIINSSISKIKQFDKPQKYKVKIALGMMSGEKMKVEHCVIDFMTDKDRDIFIQVFAEISGCSLEKQTNEIANSEAKTNQDYQTSL